MNNELREQIEELASPMTAEHIEQIRACLDDGTYTPLERKDFNALCDLALRGLNEREWIPVTERLPTHTHSVLIRVTESPAHWTEDDGFVDIGVYLPDEGKWAMNDGEDDVQVEVSHWMSLPE